MEHFIIPTKINFWVIFPGMVVIKKKLKERKATTSESSDSEESESELQAPCNAKNCDKRDTSELDDDQTALLAQNNNIEESKVIITGEEKARVDEEDSN